MFLVFTFWIMTKEVNKKQYITKMKKKKKKKRSKNKNRNKNKTRLRNSIYSNLLTKTIKKRKKNKKKGIDGM